jgi:hypothetical protein
MRRRLSGARARVGATMVLHEVAERTAELRVPVVDHPPSRARLGDVVYRTDREELAVNTVLGWVACRPADLSRPPDPARTRR